MQELIESLYQEIARFKVDMDLLKAENEVLKSENARFKDLLGLNSQNSSIPSSKELYKSKKLSRKPSGRKQGAQPGHKGHKRSEMVADEVIKVDLPSKCLCGGEIRPCGKPHIHRKIDLPEIKPHVIDYHLESGRCRLCNKKQKSELPEGVTIDLFGPRVKAMIGSLGGFYKNSKRDIERILKDLFNLDISLGTISHNEGRIASVCKEEYEKIEQSLSYSKLLHIDETSHYNKGKMGWCWLFSSAEATMIKLEKTRGKKVLENSVFGPKDNIIVSDRYAAYNYFAVENRQICWAHLARDFARLANSSYKEVSVMGEKLTVLAREVFALQRALKAKEIGLLQFFRRIKKLRKRSWYYLKNLSYLERSAIHASRVAKNIMKSESMMWKFIEDPLLIPLTNNHAERQIRHYVIYRKNSYFTQSERGNRFLERIMSLYMTWKQENLNPVVKLLDQLMMPKLATHQPTP